MSHNSHLVRASFSTLILIGRPDRNSRFSLVSLLRHFAQSVKAVVFRWVVWKISSGSHRRHNRNETVLCQYNLQLLKIGRAAGIHDGSRLLEEIRAEQRRSNDGQRLHIRLLQVVETM